MHTQCHNVITILLYCWPHHYKVFWCQPVHKMRIRLWDKTNNECLTLCTSILESIQLHIFHTTRKQGTQFSQPAYKNFILWVTNPFLTHPLSCKRSKKELNCLKVASTASSICSSSDRQTFHQNRDHKLFAMDVCSTLRNSLDDAAFSSTSLSCSVSCLFCSSN